MRCVNNRETNSSTLRRVAGENKKLNTAGHQHAEGCDTFIVRRTHLVTFPPLEGNSRGHFIRFYLLKGHPIGHPAAFSEILVFFIFDILYKCNVNVIYYLHKKNN